MITRESRFPTPAERERLTRTPAPERIYRGALLLGAAAGGVPGLGLAALVAALAMNMRLLPAHSRWALVVLMVMTGAIALWLLAKSGVSVARAVLGPRRQQPAMSDAEARGTKVLEIRADVDQAWRIDDGDDDVAWLLLRCGDSFVSLRAGVVDDLWENEDEAWVGRVLRSRIVAVLVGDVIWWLRMEGEPLPMEQVALLVDYRDADRDLYTKDLAEVERADLWPALAKQVASG